MQQIGTDTLYFDICAQNAVTHHVRPDETFEVRTQINSGPWIDRLPAGEQEQWRQRLTGGNPSSGCICVDGALPGDMLSVDVGPFELDPIGYTSFGGSTGASPEGLEIGTHAKVVEIRDDEILWCDSLKLPAQPMLGFVGVAPAEGSFHNGWGGEWGGNLDAPDVTTGTTVNLRVNHEGALLHVGDMHALQGDGEICGAGGIEASGRVQLTCRLTRPAPDEMRLPRFETDSFIAVAATGEPAEDAFRSALADLLRWIEADYGLPIGEAYLLLGQVLEAKATQFVNPTITYVVKVRKRYLEAVRQSVAD